MSAKQVDFCHLGSSQQFHSYLHRSCQRLLDKGLRTQIRAQADALRGLAAQLWRSHGAFASIEIADAGRDQSDIGLLSAQVLLSASPGQRGCQALINTAAGFPEDYADYGQIVEIFTPEPEALDAARRRFRDYRERGEDPRYHRINAEMPGQPPQR